MLVFIYNTENEVIEIDKIVCHGENIGSGIGDVTNKYFEAIPLENGTFAYISDDITNKYITDRVNVPL